MGMYDDIVCKYPLPLPEDTKGFVPLRFQTKDLDNALDCYEIREDGTLWLHECEREYTEGDPNGKTFFEKFGMVKVTKDWWTHVKTTRTIRIYDYNNYNDGPYDYWVEFEIVFIDGVIDKIKLIKFDATDNSKRKENDRQFIEELKKNKQFESTNLYKLVIKPYNKIIRFICRLLYSTGSFLIANVWKLERKLIV
jgi:hypothetical protein